MQNAELEEEEEGEILEGCYRAGIDRDPIPPPLLTIAMEDRCL